MGKEKKLHKGRKLIKCPKEVGTKTTEIGENTLVILPSFILLFQPSRFRRGSQMSYWDHSGGCPRCQY